MALANQTWVENLRGGLISQGITWDGRKKKPARLISPLADQLNRKVFSIFRAADEMVDLPPPIPFTRIGGWRDHINCDAYTTSDGACDPRTELWMLVLHGAS